MVTIRESLEQLYTGSFNAYTVENKIDPITHQTTQEFVENKVLSNIPCRLSFSTISPVKFTYEETGIPHVAQVIKIFTSPDIVVPAGSRLEVTQNGVTTNYKQSGVPAVHSNHQEIVLELYEVFA